MRYFFRPGTTIADVHFDAQHAEEWPVGTYLYNSESGRHWVRKEHNPQYSYVEWTGITPEEFPAEFKAHLLLMGVT